MSQPEDRLLLLLRDGCPLVGTLALAELALGLVRLERHLLLLLAQHGDDGRQQQRLGEDNVRVEKGPGHAPRADVVARKRRRLVLDLD